jgi:MFS superfamily sulfate permease-like transporter
LGGVPTCHGSGGIVGHYTFGARTGGSVFIYGLIYLIMGLFFSKNFEMVVKFFPLPMLGVILFFEGYSLLLLIKDIIDSKRNLMIAFLVAVISVGLNYGFLIGMLVGIVIYYTTNPNVKHTLKFGKKY